MMLWIDWLCESWAKEKSGSLGEGRYNQDQSPNHHHGGHLNHGLHRAWDVIFARFYFLSANGKWYIWVYFLLCDMILPTCL